MMIMRRTIIFIVSLSLASIAYVYSQTVSIEANMRNRTVPMKPVWAWFGYDEPNYTYMKDGVKLLGELQKLSSTPVFIRAHNLLTSGDGEAALKWGSTNAYTEDSKGNPIYNWTIVDKIIDTYIFLGMKPLVEIGFMPEALSSNPQPYRHYWTPTTPYNEIYRGWTHPPKDYNKWRELVYQWVRHSVERYGKQEVESWYWELWNEPNIGYWSGTFDEYCKLYDYTADGLKKALPTARLGGPHSTDPSNQNANTFLRNFLKHVTEGTNYATGQKGAPIDYIGFHAKGAPRVIDGNVRMNVGVQLQNVSKGFEAVADFPTLKHLPIIIGESDPEGCAACSEDHHPQNAYRNGTMYSSYTAASFARKYELAQKWGVNFLGAVSWSFEFEDQKWFAGFRDLATNGVDKPVLNVFRMFGMMKGELAEATSSAPLTADDITKNSVREAPDINALASISDDEKTAAVMIWNYHDNDLPADPAQVSLLIRGLPSIPARKVLLTHYRIDNKYSNSYEVWKTMGRPQNPTKEQIETLERSGQLEMYTSPEYVDVTNAGIRLEFKLPRQGVSLIKLDW
jgi:xylan 1,4-beta-xylosidase